MKYVGNVQSQANAEVYATASGTLPNGKPVIVNSDGTVSLVAQSTNTVSQAIGSEVVYESAYSLYNSAVFDSSTNKIVVAYRDVGNSNYGAAVVGTINPANNSISFGTPVVFNSGTADPVEATFDSNSNKVVVFYGTPSGSNVGTAKVGTVSGTTISFGSAVVFNAQATGEISAAFAKPLAKIIVIYRDSNNYGRSVVGTVSGTTISFGNETNFNSGLTFNIAATFEGNWEKAIAAFRDVSASNYGKVCVGAVSGTTISWSSEFTFNSALTLSIRAIFVPPGVYGGNKVVIAYKNGGNSNYGTVIVGTVSANSISFGSAVVFNSSTTDPINIGFDSNANKVVLAYTDGGDSNKGKILVGTPSGTTISFGSPVIFNSGATSTQSYIGSVVYDTSNRRVAVTYDDAGNSNYGTSVVFCNAFQETLNNLTTENFVGITNGVVKITGTAGGTGSETVFEAATSRYVASAYDTNTNRVVIAYADNGNSSYGTAVVGTVSGFNISFGTPVVFETAEVQDVAITFDNNSNKIVIAYADEGNSSNGTAIVGTVSGTSISFGSAVVFDGNSDSISATFDSNSNKVVIAYSDLGNSDYGTSVVGTVSGTSISFGTPVVFASGNLVQVRIEFDSNSNKVVIAYKNSANSNYGTAIIGTVSGTGISFGTAVVFLQENARSVGLVIDSTNNKVIVAYADNGNSRIGTARVGTISGTGISFGTAVAFSSGEAEFYTSLVYNPTIQKVVIAYRDNTSNTLLGKYNVGTVSGTDISFTGEVVFNAGRSDNISLVYDPDSVTLINSFEDNANSSYGTSIVFTPSTLATNRGSTASGSTAIIQAGGAVNTLQTGLTPGQQYFVQTDGTLGLTAASPSVLAGTAVSATDLIVKG